MPTYRLSEPIVAAFVLIPLLLAAALVWSTIEAWRRSGASRSAAHRAGAAMGIATAAWMALTWAAATSGILRDWDRTPPPFAFLVLGVFVVSLTLSLSPVGAANLPGLGLLVNVVTVAIVSTPRIRYFGDQQVVTFVTYTPFVWLPVMVAAALAGHLVIFRALRRL